MKSKETKIDIDVNLYGTRFSVKVPFSGQDAVRATEEQMKAYLMELRNRHSGKTITECMAMMAYNYASNYFALKAQRESDTALAEDLLRDTAGMLGEKTPDDGERGLFPEFGEF